MTYTAPHKFTDRSKLASLIRAFRRGDSITPVVVLGEQAVTGSHRIEAARRAGVEVPSVKISDLDYRRAAYVAGIETHDQNFNGFCAALLAVTDDSDIRTALEDQTDGEWVDADRVEEALEMTEGELTEARGW